MGTNCFKLHLAGSVSMFGQASWERGTQARDREPHAFPVSESAARLQRPQLFSLSLVFLLQTLSADI